jgi:hypothetical protein
MKLLAAACIVWFAVGVSAVEPAGLWKVKSISLKPRAELIDGTSFNWEDITLNVSDMQHRTDFTLSAKVALSEVREQYLYGDKLAVVGIAGNTEEVVIFDLRRREEVDWFDCDGAKQVLPGKIVIAMWVPNHPASTNDVVLMLYDLAKSPSANRLKNEPNAHFPLSVEAQGEDTIDVGMPIYPQENANLKSYNPTSRESEDAIISADLNTIVAVSAERLVFMAQKGFEDDWLEVLDLPHGVAKAKSRRIEIPKEQLHPDPQWVKLHQPFNPNLVSIGQIEVLSPTQIRLHIPAEEYGVDHLDVQIPDRQ